MPARPYINERLGHLVMLRDLYGDTAAADEIEIRERTRRRIDSRRRPDQTQRIGQ